MENATERQLLQEIERLQLKVHALERELEQRPQTPILPGVTDEKTSNPTVVTAMSQTLDNQSLLQIMTSANCLLTYCLAWEDETGAIHWQHYLPDAAAAQRFLPLTVPAGETYINTWSASRLKEDHLRMHVYGRAQLRANRSYTQKYRCRRADGEIRWLSEYVHVETLEPRVWKLVTISIDITDRKREEKNLQYLMAGAQCLLWYAIVRDVGEDLDWDLQFADEEAALRFLPVDIAPGEPFTEACYRARPLEDNARMNAVAQQEIRRGNSYRQEFRCQLRDGSMRWVNEQVNVEPIGEGIWRAIGVCTDITEHKKQEELIQQQVERLAALARDNATLFENLQKTNADLSCAYDATIEGWSRALDLRDKETEGHSQRVTAMALRLAQTMGVTETELQQMRYGALLHDIGKMGIPDSILLKPAALSAEEWIIMRQHPIHAVEMLSPITFLRPALDIPYCHHEKWDGSGYPRGLKGLDIPLAARIFAVVDIWDAMRHDRPYRKALPREHVREYIRSIAGTHLDPAIVEVFLRMEW